MKTNHVKSNQMGGNAHGLNRIIIFMGLLFLGVTLFVFACGKGESKELATNISGKKTSDGSVSAQPLPGGRAYFTSAIGHFQTSTGQACWVRMVNYTFNTAGTVSATLTQWSSLSEFDKTQITNHTCSIDGTPKTCGQYSPTGWVVGLATNPSFTWSGTYTYDTVTGALHISWPNVGSGASEDWTVSNVTGKALSKLTFVTSSGNYGITDGYGYGSSRPFTGTGNYKTVDQVPKVDMTGNVRSCYYSGVAGDPYVVSGSPQNMPFSLMGGVTGGSAIHMKVPTSPDACSAGCYVPSTGHTGIIYHLTSLNNSRQMAYNHHCACLPSPTQYPCYSGTIHPYAMMQIIDDNGAMQGLVGIHQQDPAGSAGFSYSINQWLFP